MASAMSSKSQVAPIRERTTTTAAATSMTGLASPTLVRLLIPSATNYDPSGDGPRPAHWQLLHLLLLDPLHAAEHIERRIAATVYACNYNPAAQDITECEYSLLPRLYRVDGSATTMRRPSTMTAPVSTPLCGVHFMVLATTMQRPPSTMAPATTPAARVHGAQCRQLRRAPPPWMMVPASIWVVPTLRHATTDAPTRRPVPRRVRPAQHRRWFLRVLPAVRVA